MKVSPPSTLAALAWATWLVSLALPAVVFEPARQTLVRERIVTRGWEAARISLTGPAELTRDRRRILVRVMGLTNLLMPMAAVAFRARRQAAGRVLAVITLAAAVFNQSAYFWLDPAIRSHMAIGYWVWVTSFVLLGLALALPRTTR